MSDYLMVVPEHIARNMKNHFDVVFKPLYRLRLQNINIGFGTQIW